MIGKKACNKSGCEQPVYYLHKNLCYFHTKRAQGLISKLSDYEPTQHYNTGTEAEAYFSRRDMIDSGSFALSKVSYAIK